LLIKRKCEVCGQIIWIGKDVYYEFPPGSENTKYETIGDYLRNCGKCVICNRELCLDCGDLTSGVCRDCRKFEGVSDE